MIDKELMQKKMIFLGQMLTLHIARQCFFRQFKMVKIVMSMALNDWHPVWYIYSSCSFLGRKTPAAAIDALEFQLRQIENERKKIIESESDTK